MNVSLTRRCRMRRLLRQIIPMVEDDDGAGHVKPIIIIIILVIIDFYFDF